MSEDRPPWDQDAADRLIGAIVVVGMNDNELGGVDQIRAVAFQRDRGDGVDAP